MQCPKCDSQYVVKNGHTHTGKQNFKCRDCGRQFVTTPRPDGVTTPLKPIANKGLTDLW